MKINFNKFIWISPRNWNTIFTYTNFFFWLNVIDVTQYINLHEDLLNLTK